MVDWFPWTNGEVLDADALNQSLGYCATTYQEKVTGVGSPAGSSVFANALKFAIVKNIGSDTTYIDCDGVPGYVGSDYGLTKNEVIVLNGGADGISTLYYSCGSGNTSEIRILGTY